MSEGFKFTVKELEEWCIVFDVWIENGWVVVLFSNGVRFKFRQWQ